MDDETFDCFELPGVPGGLRACLTWGIARYLGVACAMDSGGHREKAMKAYPGGVLPPREGRGGGGPAHDGGGCSSVRRG